jgi:hypothetical protein
MYVALHIADPEVSALMAKYVEVTGMSKTEALRHLLRDAIQQEMRKQKKSRFREIAYGIMEQARKENQKPYTKEESDALFEGTGE